MIQLGQLEINFEKNRAVRQHLQDGDFSLIVEIPLPAKEQPFQLSMLPATELAGYAAEESRITALAITEGFAVGAERHDLGRVIARLREFTDKELIPTVVGRDLTDERLKGSTADLDSAGIASVLAVTGFAPQTPQRPNGRPGDYMDSTRILGEVRKRLPDVLRGAVVNPFKYNVADAYLQYYKMVRKLNAGADFLVTEAGWDAKKHQELQWYLRQRGLAAPVIARLRAVRSEDVVGIIDGEAPGQTLSREYATMLQREAALGDEQAFAAQLRRLALLAAGCKIFGYSGVQIAGVLDVEKVSALIDHIHDTFEELPDYASWLRAWEDFHNRVEPAPYPHSYYLYRNLLTSDGEYSPDTAKATKQPLPTPTFREKLAFKTGRALALQRRHGPLAAPLKRLLCGTGDAAWQLDKTYYKAASACPKGLEAGACGGSRPDGSCELGHGPCFFHHCLSLARWDNSLESFESVSDAP
ncbi:MAG: methylenetetrahydrofolate reductase (NADPH) [Rhodothermales bacterium]|jgi:methylenetetrahydrofolate reductase (NADPH)